MWDDPNDRIAFFRERAALFRKELEIRNKAFQQNSLLRLSAFLILCGGAISGGAWGIIHSLLFALPGLLAFALLLKRSARLKNEVARVSALIRIQEDEIAKLSLDPLALASSVPVPDNHPYAHDLDMTGRFSLMGLTSRASTSFGQKQLMEWLLHPVPVKEWKMRQDAVKELEPEVEWRQELQVAGQQQEPESPEVFLKWLNAPPLLPENDWRLKVAPVLVAATLTCILLSVFGFLSAMVPVVLTGIHVLWLRMFRRQINETFARVEGKWNHLKGYANALEVAAAHEFQSEWLNSEMRPLQGSDAAAEELRKLKRILDRTDLRGSGIAGMLISLFLLWELYCVRELEKWQKKNSARAATWLSALGKLEAVSSLAAVAFAHPEWCWPVIGERKQFLKAKDAGHPLISPRERVLNPVEVNGPGSVSLITGSNMSGKSTYLRTVGVNAVLALTGGKVCATEMQCGPLQVWTSMRTQDDISGHVSSFYAELRRIRAVLDAIRAGEPVLFLLDEILKGTNSQDRHKGAKALVRQLHTLGATGYISTHDLELVSMESEMQGWVKNYSFNCDLVEGGKLSFDYRLTEGPCRSFNASELMRQMGIGENL